MISLNDTSFYACNSVGCVVTKGQFENFCLRFAESFNLNSTEWSPALMTTGDKHMSANSAFKSPMNAWVVPFGSYEVCSSTIEKERLIETLSSIKIKHLLRMILQINLKIIKKNILRAKSNLDTFSQMEDGRYRSQF